jgi:hypothetical protein
MVFGLSIIIMHHCFQAAGSSHRLRRMVQAGTAEYVNHTKPRFGDWQSPGVSFMKIWNSAYPKNPALKFHGCCWCADHRRQSIKKSPEPDTQYIACHPLRCVLQFFLHVLVDLNLLSQARG